MGRMAVDMAELVEHWTVLDEEQHLIAGKRGATRLGFALLLKFYTRHGRFPRDRSEFPCEVVDHLGRQTGVPAAEFELYEWSGSTFFYHKRQIREHLGFRECSVALADKLTEWLAVNVAHAERDPGTVRVELLKKLREECVEPPTPGRLDEMVTDALRVAERSWFAAMPARLAGDGRARVLALVGWCEPGEDGTVPESDDAAAEAEDDPRESVLALIKSMPGNVSLESLKRS